MDGRRAADERKERVRLRSGFIGKPRWSHRGGHVRYRTISGVVAFAGIIGLQPGITLADGLNHISTLSRECHAGNENSCRKLAKIAVGDGDIDLRVVAVAGLTDQALLAKLALGDDDVHAGTIVARHAFREPGSAERYVVVRAAAARNLIDQSLLAKIAVTDPDFSVRAAAAEKLTDQTLLAKLALEDRDKRVQTAAAMRLSDQSLLALVARNGANPNARYAAAGKLMDMHVLGTITDGETKRNARSRMDMILSLRRLLAESELLPQSRSISLQVAYMSQAYVGVRNRPIEGETVEMSVMSAKETMLAHRSWKTEFPPRIADEPGPIFIPAKVDLTDLLVDLCKSEHYSASQVKTSLIKIAIKDADWEVQRAAMAKLTTFDEQDAVTGSTPLHWVAHNGDKELAQLLLADRADPNAKNSAGETPLHVAAARGNREMAELLLAHGADPNAKDNFGQTPLRVASSYRYRELEELLRQHGGHE